MKKGIVILGFALLSIPMMAQSQGARTNFLPLDDEFAPTRNTPKFANSNIKPYRESFSLGEQKIQSSFSFSNTDILAFVLLAGVYIILVRKNSKPRNLNL